MRRQRMPYRTQRQPEMVAAIALGSNLASTFGPPEANLREALRRLQEFGAVVAVSSFHVTTPVGYLDQPNFMNAAALLDTPFAPQELLTALLEVERCMGRDRTQAPSKGPRTIDLDLLLYGDSTMQTPSLVLPHPAMHERAFVLAPLAEIAPAMCHPLLRKTVAELLAELRAS